MTAKPKASKKKRGAVEPDPVSVGEGGDGVVVPDPKAPVACGECGSVPSVAPIVGGGWRLRCHCPKTLIRDTNWEAVDAWNAVDGAGG